MKNVQIIKDCCELANIPYPKSHTVDWTDRNVWEHIADSPVGIFQLETSFAFESMKKFKCRRINDLSLVNAAIRPSGESYRDKLLSRQTNKNPSKLIDNLLSANHGFLVFQEDTIKFLTEICGLSGSEADNVRRAIGRKQKDRLEAALPRILEGYCSKSDKPREVAEVEAKEFLQIIEDSSSYQFGQNHSTGYSMIGYMCAYLRYYYPKEFVTAYLNNANNEDDVKLGTQLARQFGIPIHGIRFRHSTSKYSCDKTGIYKGMSSVKFLNDVASDELYSIRDEHFDDFADVLARIEGLDVDSRKLNILIKLDFFKEFGDIMYLLDCADIFQKYYGKRQIKKEKVLEDGLCFDLVRACSEKETPKMFSGLNSMLLIKRIIGLLPQKHTTLKQRVAFQLECLGYIDIVDKKYAGYCVATDVDTTYSPKIKLYALANGNTIPVKVNKKLFATNIICTGDIVHVRNQCKRNKMKKVNGEWEKSDEMEWWITDYEICRGDDVP